MLKKTIALICLMLSIGTTAAPMYITFEGTVDQSAGDHIYVGQHMIAKIMYDTSLDGHYIDASGVLSIVPDDPGFYDYFHAELLVQTLDGITVEAWGNEGGATAYFYAGTISPSIDEASGTLTLFSFQDNFVIGLGLGLGELVVGSPISGSAFFKTDTQEIRVRDLIVTYHDVVTPVPMPAAVWLFGSALLGLMGVAIRKKA